ncbi:MATE family efflux transporter [Cohnella sp. AR92]|uniref:MATE family efflux transporter n=1 Tax=Cohnella sp. AR92 TaxID=648716 RepID=UPI000F8CA357|nr:MATE family efflux transporter [Cohnella sp. AR92]RUS46675.1 MATE family efflux transporter [Cohnella sp. AR92]
MKSETAPVGDNRPSRAGERKRSRLGLWSLSWPIGMELLLQFLMGTVDTLMVSRIGDNAASAVGVSNQVIQTAMTLFAVINAGAGAIIARMWGAGEQAKARQTAAIAIKANLIFGVAGGLVLAFGSGAVVGLMGVPAQVRGYGVEYLSIVGGGIGVMTLHLAVNALIRNIGNTKGPMLATLGMNLLHLVLNYLLIFGIGWFPELGVQGTAISTVISRSFGLALSFWLLWRMFVPRMTLGDWMRTDRGLLKDIVGIGIPVSVTAMSWGFSQIVLISIISSFGPKPLAAYTYVQTIQQFPWMIASAIGSALGIQIGQWFGAGFLGQVYRGPIRAIVAGVSLALTASAAIWAAGEPLLSLFTEDREVVSAALPLLAICILWQPMRIVPFCLSNSLNITGGARAVAVLSVIGMWLVATGGAYAFGALAGWGVIGVYVAAILDEAMRGSYFAWRWIAFKPDGKARVSSSGNADHASQSG